MKSNYKKYYFNNQKLYTGFQTWLLYYGYDENRNWVKLESPVIRFRKVRYGPVISCIDNDWQYEHKWAGYYRKFAFKQEITQMEADLTDMREDRLRWKVKTNRRRSNWDDQYIGREKKNWKRAHKCKKQWMINL